MTKYYLAAFVAAFMLFASSSLAAENSLAIDLGQNVKLELVLVKKGQFKQGSPRSEAGRGDDETPRRVTISKDFYLGKYPVTVGQFRRFADDTGYRSEAEAGPSGGFGFDGKGLVQRKAFNWRNPGYPLTEECPVTIVTYNDARAFARWLARKAARKVSLPTEAQWEYACRAGTTSRFYAGDAESDLQAIGWYRGNSENAARPVGQKQPNDFGLYDMSGNVYEWCRDWYGPYGDDANDPEETRSDRTTPPRRVLRSGSWLKEARQCRSAARFRNTPSSRNADNGFRVAAEAAPALEASPAEQPKPNTTSLRWPHGEPQLLRADFGPVFILIVLAFIVVMIFRAVQKAGSGGGPFQQGPPPNRPSAPNWRAAGMAAGTMLHHETAADGFWINTQGLLTGSVIQYSCEVYGAPHHGTVVVEPGGRQFIYTGGAPSQVRITQVTRTDEAPTFPAGTTPYSSPGPLGGHTSHPSHPPSRPPTSSPEPAPGPTFSGFPSAY